MDNPSTLPLENDIQRQAVLGFLRKHDLKQIAIWGAMPTVLSSEWTNGTLRQKSKSGVQKLFNT